MPAQPFTVQIRPARERLVVAVCGEIDLATAPQVEAAVIDAVADGWTRVVIDLRAVSFMDSAGVHLLLALLALRALGARGVSCQMIDGRPEVHSVLELCGHGDVIARVDPAVL